MQFPYSPTTDLQHQMGGRIVKVHGIAHQACKAREGRSLDGWWFDCDVLWQDSGKVSRSPVEPYKMVADEGIKNPDMQVLLDAMTRYLSDNGEWCTLGPHQGWYAHRPTKKLGPVWDSKGRLMASVGPQA
jgi:hypothetical protein